jgi:hypothetical protein
VGKGAWLVGFSEDGINGAYEEEKVPLLTCMTLMVDCVSKRVTYQVANLGLALKNKASFRMAGGFRKKYMVREHVSASKDAGGWIVETLRPTKPCHKFAHLN